MNREVRSRRTQFTFAAAVLFALASPVHAQQTPVNMQRQLARVDAAERTGPFRADWNSLAGYRVPDWFRDAKFGIFIHWGVYSVPAFGNEWYSRNMYVEGNAAFKHHVATYGPQSKFGYKDFIPMFRAEHFDANAWLDLFAQAGARYVVPVAEHCDGFAMYDSSLTDWDAAKMGPHRDVVGELEAATRSHGLHFGVSSHRAEHWWWYDGGTNFDSDVRDPRYAGLYGPAQPMALPGEDDSKEPDPDHLERWLPPEQGLPRRLARAQFTELVDKYHPDFLYFDWWIGQPAFQPYLQRFAAYYYDEAASRQQGVVLTYKGYDFPENAATLDIERGKLDTLRLLPWQTDTSVSIHSWGYVRQRRVPQRQVTHRRIGRRGQQERQPAAQRGTKIRRHHSRAGARHLACRWARGSKPTARPSTARAPGSSTAKAPPKSPAPQKTPISRSSRAEDIRFTTHNGALYAIALGWPADGELRIRSLASGLPYLKGPVCEVKMLGSDAPLSWHQEADGLHIQLPQQRPNEPAWTFRIMEPEDAARGCGN